MSGGRRADAAITRSRGERGFWLAKGRFRVNFLIDVFRGAHRAVLDIAPRISRVSRVFWFCGILFDSNSFFSF
jgi:transcription elongation factor